MPDLARLYSVIGATWPPAEVRKIGPVTLRKGGGGGSRVSAATVDGQFSADALQGAEGAMRAWGQTPRFMLRDGDAALDAHLAEQGYVLHDRTGLYMCNIDIFMTERPPHVSTFVSWPPLSVQREIWAEGGIGPERVAIMTRAQGPKTTVLGRMDDRPAGTLFVALDQDIAMVHAVEVRPAHRRKGLAKHMMKAAAFWARDQGARYMTLLTTSANSAANPLYASLGMDVVGHYHYRKLPE